ncbi:MAG: peptide-methionine (S)-S-oxide reductase MsrA [Candidatus Acidiferrum sp.]
MNRLLKIVSALLLVVLFWLAYSSWTAASSGPAAAIPDAKLDDTLAAKSGQSTIVLAGGCFWGLQAVFEHVKGVDHVTAGYSGGTVKNPGYEEVSGGRTGHAESVEIVYDPSKITLGQLLKVFFSVAHDPTELNRQGPDEGTQYRSEIFFATPDQQRIAQAYVDQLNQAKLFSRPIVTQIAPFEAFYRAEDYHQDYAILHPDNPYIAMFDLPKVKNLQHEFPTLYR